MHSIPLASSCSSGAPRPSTKLRKTVLALQLALGGLPLISHPLVAQAQAAASASAEQTYDIPEGPLAESLIRFAQQAGVTISVDAAKVRELRSPGLHGRHTVESGFADLLAKSGYRASKTQAGYILTPPASTHERTHGTAEKELPTVTVQTSAVAQAVIKPAAGGQVANGGRLGVLGNTNVMDAPYNLTSYTSEKIENDQARTVGEVLQNDPSVRYTTPAGHAIENYVVRGFLINAQDLAFNGMFGLTPVGRVPTEFVERVEVLRGASAMLSGMSPNGAVGGIINIVPKRAGEEPLMRISTDYASENQIGTHIDASRRFGEEGQFGVRVNGAYRSGDTGVVEGQSRERNFASLATDYRGDKLQVTLDAYSLNEEFSNGSPMMISFSGTDIPKAPDSSTNILKGTNGTLVSNGAVVHGDYQLANDLELYASLGTQDYRYDGYINGTRAASVTSTGTYTGYTYNQRGYVESVSAEGGLRKHFTTGPVQHTTIVGFSNLSYDTGTITSTSKSYTSNIYSPTTPLLASDPGGAPKTGETMLSSSVLADTLDMLNKRLSLTVGARHQRVHDKSFSSLGALTALYEKQRTSPAAAIVVKPWGENISLYANYIEGLTKGGSVSDTAAANYLETFAPYVSKQGEIGIKWNAGTFMHTFDIFQITQPSLIKGTVTNSAGKYSYSVDGEQRNRGAEWGTSGYLTQTIKLLGGITYNNAELIKTASGAYDGNTAYGTPKWLSNLGTEWDVPGLTGVTLTARAVHTGSEYLNSANTQKISAWTRYDAGARYTTTVQGKKTVFRFNVENLLDKDYWVGGYHAEGYTTQSAPRTFSLSATFDL